MVTKPLTNSPTKITVTIKKAMTALGSNTVFPIGRRFTTEGPLKAKRNLLFDAQQTYTGPPKVVVANKSDLTVV